MFDIPVLGICAQASGMGKTTLIEAILPELATYGLRVSIIKQTHAEFDVDRPGKDSYRLRGAGAAQVMLSSENRWVLMTEIRSEREDDRVLDMVRHLDPELADLVLVEGFRHAPIPKIEVFRPSCGKSLLARQDGWVIAVASDLPVATARPVLDLNAPRSVAKFIVEWWARQQVHETKRFLTKEML
jgi:molybdopterin-guanine dinucleotide biosynthesis protein B